MKFFRFLALSVAGLFVSAALPAQSCVDETCFGPFVGTTVSIGGTWNIADGAILDFGPRHVIFQPSALLNLEGIVTISAAKITMQPGSRIDGTQTGQYFAVPSVFMTTTAAGGHDGAATLAGVIDLSGSGYSYPGWSGGSFSLVAAGDVQLATLNTSAGDAFAAGQVYVSGQVVTIGGISATAIAGYYSQAASVTLVSYGDMTVGAVDTSFGTYSGSSTISVVCSGNYVQTGALSAVKLYSSYADLDQGTVSVVVSGSATIMGSMATGYAGGPLLGGGCSVSAGGDLLFTGSIIAQGAQGGGASLQSVGGDVTFSGSINVLADDGFSGSGYGEFGGFVFLRAARDVDVSGTVAAPNMHVPPNGFPSSVWFEAGRDVIVRAGATVSAVDALSGPGTGGLVTILGCRVTVQPGATVAVTGAGSSYPIAIAVEANDVLRNDGTMSAPAISVATRLPPPWGVSGSGTFSTPPFHTFDPTRPPCLADFTTTFLTNGPIAPGATATLSLTGPPSKSVLALVSVVENRVSLGAFGFTQVDLPPNASVLADDLGLFGPPLPALTDSAGVWSFSAPTPAIPALVGVTIYADLYVLDLAARNGYFHQPRRAALLFQ